jgi:hypothetical protein
VNNLVGRGVASRGACLACKAVVISEYRYAGLSIIYALEPRRLEGLQSEPHLSTTPRLGGRIDLAPLLSDRVLFAPRTDVGRSGASPYQISLP